MAIREILKSSNNVKKSHYIFMTLKEIEKTQLENKKLYEENAISKNEYIKKQFELLKELDEHKYRLENIHLEFLKNIKNWFRKKINKKE